MTSTVVRPLQLAARPDFALWQARFPDRFPGLLESAAVGLPLGRYDILLRAAGPVLSLGADGRVSGAPPGTRFLDEFDRLWRQERIDEEPSELPFRGGWCLYLGYELAGEIEPRLRLPAAHGLVASAVRCPAAAIYDHVRGEAWLVAERGFEALLDSLEADLGGPPPAFAEGHGHYVVTEEEPERYRLAVEAALRHIACGDIYQANLSRRWQATMPDAVSAAGLYRRLRRANPGPFAGILSLAGMDVLSTSPERLVEVRGGMIQTRPIAGTRPRGSDDAAAIAELVASAKERAEHVMLIDLERNDLGRICRPGTVKVSEFGVVESYAHVHHLVSNVRGEILPGTTPGEVIRALFPGGTITGCPKVRCMEIIADIEAAPRGAYTGSFGYVNRDGSMDLNILIRTATVTGNVLDIRAGAGIVADSQPGRELEETRAKARGLLRGLGLS
jgi:anthranilate synthase component I